MKKKPGKNISREKMALLHKNMHKKLNGDMIRKLGIINVNTVFDFLQQDTGKLEKLIKLDRKDVIEIKEQIVENFSGKIESGIELLQFEQNSITSTGISRLDELLNGGLHSGELYEFCGLSSAGKTQLCLSIAINVILEENCVVHYIDTKRDFSGSRVHTILEAKDHNDDERRSVMNQIKVTRASNVYALLSVLYILTRTLKNQENEKSTKLVIIDSLPAIILSSSEKSQNFRFLSHLAGVLKFLANEYHICVITINLVNRWHDNEGFGAALVQKATIVKPTLGKFWLHVPTTRLRIEKLQNEKRKIIVWKSIGLKDGTNCHVNLSNVGFT